MSWWVYALLSALFAALTAVLAKVGVEGVPSTLATALRTCVVLVFAWGISLARGEHAALPSLSRKTLLFLALSGIATGLSWLAYFRALQLGPASRVAPLDKLSLPLTVLLAVVLLHEPLSWKLGAGVALMVAGALLTLR
ncbi:EamA family transporter [Myxococcus sp. CA051A]|uniref:EamA family transporter n=1 Tax=Myxococcus llanfairpwllgwyngyllgogerychwyrndrobwllllantysiliogogogochensis TaxID=2590453 RepID=A0A540X1N0_9BACT|nr:MULTISPECIES: EamA family transporter [Myxococcus]NTX06028.1 EamA family transporter [Myxococcus sp. CA040A]NTX37649.1 EamA family transporter [Myxococcus sp. CA033]NTX51287.1 EamA family transporter [Myxococcus sp. CA039A]NTX61295.1 EamA family transporter [Myxococcus sp. CA051A]TQF15175.1 EamA family transporter [Myxococcus llanfairpwllgwyngyllgogerychwyrndrobwllllantysiliogogogochensis]